MTAYSFKDFFPLIASLCGALIGLTVSLYVLNYNKKRQILQDRLHKVYSPFIRYYNKYFTIEEGDWGFGNMENGKKKRSLFFNETMKNIEYAPAKIVDVYNLLYKQCLWQEFTVDSELFTPVGKDPDEVEQVNDMISNTNLIFYRFTELIFSDYKKCREKLKYDIDTDFLSSVVDDLEPGSWNVEEEL